MAGAGKAPGLLYPPGGGWPLGGFSFHKGISDGRKKIYPGSMNTQLIPFPTCGQILLLITPDSLTRVLFEMVARLAQHGPLYVLDGGNTFQGYPLARALRRQTADIAGVMQQVLLSRAFTCYQMAALLGEEPLAPYPVLVLDFLATFYDQNIRIAERRRLLQTCLQQLKRLSQNAPVAVWVRQRQVIPQEALGFLEIVQSAAGQVWRPERLPAASPRQPSLLLGL